MAKLYFRYGNMNSGKSMLLLQTAHNYEEQDMKILVMKSSIDTKGDKAIVSRVGPSREVDELLDKKANILKLVKEKYNDVSCVLIDEAQFLTPRQVDECMMVVLTLDIPVICYGLRTDFQTKAFPGSARLLAIAHTIEEIKTICTCGRKTLYNARYVNGKFVIKGNQVVIDNQDDVRYVSMCGKCYLEEQEKAKGREYENKN